LVVDNSAPVITTIIPTFRRPKLLRRAIRSVLNQTYPQFRVSVYDNASGDETPRVVEDFAQRDPRVEYHGRRENIGACRNFADAAGRVSTPFFSFLSDDDILLPEFYKVALDGFHKFPAAMMSVTASVWISEQGEVSGIPILTNWRPGLYHPPDGLLHMVTNGHPEWTSVLFRRELLEQIGPPDIEVGGPFDLDFLLRTAARFPLAVTSQPGALFVIHDQSAGVAGGFEALCSGWYKIICKLEDDETIPLKARSRATQVLSRNMKRLLLRCGVSLIAMGDWPRADAAILYLKRCCRLSTEPFMLKLLAKSCQHFSLSRRALSGVMAVSRRVSGTSTSFHPDEQTQSRFAGYARCLEL
jgi:glycosyltransferase involved in cell wall biosynthesis